MRLYAAAPPALDLACFQSPQRRSAPTNPLTDIRERNCAPCAAAPRAFHGRSSSASQPRDDGTAILGCVLSPILCRGPASLAPGVRAHPVPTHCHPEPAPFAGEGSQPLRLVSQAKLLVTPTGATTLLFAVAQRKDRGKHPYSPFATSRIDSSMSPIAQSACSSSIISGGDMRIEFSPDPSVSNPFRKACCTTWSRRSWPFSFVF
jgi:hypothetical protein